MNVPHSPSPWRFDPRFEGCKSIGYKTGRNKQSQHHKIATTVGLSNEAEDRANAAIMAAAPELLAATRLLASYGCAESTCSNSVDLATGKRGDELCGVCAAFELLERIERQARVPKRRQVPQPKENA